MNGVVAGQAGHAAAAIRAAAGAEAAVGGVEAAMPQVEEDVDDVIESVAGSDCDRAIAELLASAPIATLALEVDVHGDCLMAAGDADEVEMESLGRQAAKQEAEPEHAWEHARDVEMRVEASPRREEAFAFWNVDRRASGIFSEDVEG